MIMTRNVKWRITAIVLLLMAVTNGIAQPNKDFLDATKAAMGNITLPTPAAEINSLPIDLNLHKFVPKTGKTIVGALLRPNDYHKYYKGKAQADLTGIRLWVFDPLDTKHKFQTKVPTSTDRTWKRFCQFLGLDAIEYNIIKIKDYYLLEHIGIRDTIIYLEVDKSKLFRPAYETDISKAVTKTPTRVSPDQCTFSPTNPASVSAWLVDQQCHNTYPWTRLGYTYDWGHPTNHIGATEFILESGRYPIKHYLSGSPKVYDTVADFSR